MRTAPHPVIGTGTLAPQPVAALPGMYGIVNGTETLPRMEAPPPEIEATGTKQNTEKQRRRRQPYGKKKTAPEKKAAPNKKKLLRTKSKMVLPRSNALCLPFTKRER